LFWTLAELCRSPTPKPPALPFQYLQNNFQHSEAQTIVHSYSAVLFHQHKSHSI
jgi:hypothetical protein